MILKRNNLILFFLSICLLLLTGLFFFLEFSSLERIILPILSSILISLGIYGILFVTNKDKFVPKIYLISILVHFIFILLWQIIKYYLLGLPMPTENNFVSFISDNDGQLYHAFGVELSNNYHLDYLSEKYTGGLFPKIVATIYYFFDTNPFIVSCFNSLCASFVSVIVYLIALKVLSNNLYCKIYALLTVFCTSYIVNSSVLIRDAYITLFMYLSIFISYKFFKVKNPIYLVLTLFSLYLLFLFRPYCAFITLLGIVLTFLFIRMGKIEQKNGILKTNKNSMIMLILFPLLVVLLIGIVCYSVKFMNMFSVLDLIELREIAYSSDNSGFTFDFNMLFHIFPLLPFVIGYICLFFSPFPWEWLVVKRLHFVPDMIVLYCMLPSFFKNLILIFKNRNYYLMCFVFTLFIMFSIYCITLGNSGAIYRLRGLYIPMIYLIAMYNPDKFLRKIFNKIQKWGIV